MDIKVNSESKENTEKKVENTEKVTKIEEKTEEKLNENVKKGIVNQIQMPIYGSEINYII